MKRILVLEDEFFLLDSMTKYLRGLPDVRVYGYGNLKAAVQGIRDHAPDLIFSDIRLPDGSGLSLIDELNSMGMAVPLVFISAYVADHRERIPDNHHISVLEKPVSLKKLRDLAQEKLTAADDSGEFFFKLSDYLQIAAMGRHTVRVNCGSHGFIVVVDGRPHHAQDAGGDGVSAFKRIVAACEVGGAQVPITCARLEEAQIGPESLSGSLDGLLLDAVREVDEQERGRLEAADSEDEASTEDFDAAYERGVELMLAKDYRAAHQAFSVAHQMNPDHNLVRTNLERLSQLI